MANFTSIDSNELLGRNCEWFSLAPECDIPSWLALVIGTIIGGVLATLFFAWQWKIRKEHRELGVKKIYFDLMKLRNKIENFYKIIDTFYEDKITKEEFYLKRDERKYEIDRLSYDYALYALSMKPGVSMHMTGVVNFASAEYDLTNKEADYVRNATMTEEIDLLLDVLKEEYPKAFEDAKKESEEASKTFLSILKPLQRTLKLLESGNTIEAKKEMDSFTQKMKDLLKKLEKLMNKRY